MRGYAECVPLSGEPREAARLNEFFRRRLELNFKKANTSALAGVAFIAANLIAHVSFCKLALLAFGEDALSLGVNSCAVVSSKYARLIVASYR